MASNISEFEKPIALIEEQIARLREISERDGVDRSDDIAKLSERVDSLLRKIFSSLTPWDKTLLARHPKRPYTLDYVSRMCSDFTELHGDRLGHDDSAIVGGLAALSKRRIVLIGQQKGRDLKQRRMRNFGSAKPSGYRKALRLMHLAAKFGLPVVCFVDTPAADCSVESEAEGISESIARNMMEMAALPTPVVIAVLGEGGSGGAIGVGVGDRILMMEHSIYSVIPPEGCAAILWRDPGKAEEAAGALRLTAEGALELGVIDEIVPEPLGGAHRDYDGAARALEKALNKHLREIERLSTETLLKRRYEKFRAMGRFAEAQAAGSTALPEAGARKTKKVANAASD
jgi:acetyl-CoA carboxylase carboxyl transferase subunit alpha